MLERIRGPADLQRLSRQQLTDLAHEIRQFLIHKVAATGGHLGPNLGVVELTLALHRVFDAFPLTHHVECVALLSAGASQRA